VRLREPRVAVITGGGGDLGRSLAKAFAAEGARVVLLDIPPALQLAVALCRRLGADSFALRCDVSRESNVRQAFRSIGQRCGRINFLINNAGIEGPTRPVEVISLSDWERTLGVNLTGAFLCAREALPLMRGRGGSIVQIGSVAASIAYSLRLPYAVSKAALEALTRGLAAELGRYRIRVNVVAPGPIAGARMDRVIRERARATGRSENAVRESYAQASCLERMVTMDDVVRLVVFLCSPAAANITSQMLEVSAGWMAQRL
jgi:NAD(P)-dependent dehydrogenase (short-subunit alcohol dehydrogenase family)